jgi:hypothetical protein
MATRVSIHSTVLVLGLLLASPACTISGNCVVGTIGCSCTASNACDPGLTCTAGGAGESSSCQSGSGGVPGPVPSGQPPTNHRDTFVGLYSGSYVPDQGGLLNDYWLFEGTRVVQGFLVSRVDGSFDFRASAALSANRSGSYRTGNGQLSVVWDHNGSQNTYPTFRSPRGDLALTIDGESYYPVYPAVVRQLLGRFVSKTSSSLGTQSGVPGTPSTVVSTSATLQFDFTADGKFTYDRNAIATGTTTVPGSGGPGTVDNQTNMSGDRRTGSYRINGLFMTLVFADGTAAQDIFQGETAEADPNAGFFWGKNFYYRR